MKYLALILISINSFCLDLKVVTEEYPPFQFERDGKIVGISTEITTEIFKRAKINHTLAILPWKRAYDMAHLNINTCLYSAYNTPERENLFKWVGPLAVDKWVFVTNADSNIKINDIDDVKKYNVGGYAGDGISLHLKALGIKVQDVTLDYQNALKLSKKRIDIWATSSFSWPLLAKDHNVKKLKEIHTFNKLNLNLACNKSIPDKTIILMNKILIDLESEGFIDAVFKKYGIDSNL